MIRDLIELRYSLGDWQVAVRVLLFDGGTTGAVNIAECLDTIYFSVRNF